MKLLDTKPVNGVVIFKTLSFNLFRNMSKLLPINGSDRNRRAAEINLYHKMK
jgi:hypothetical protein